MHASRLPLQSPLPCPVAVPIIMPPGDFHLPEANSTKSADVQAPA